MRAQQARERIFRGLNEDQRSAVEAVRGPVCILAGAGSGKTTTITRRIAQQVATGAFRPGQILAVTFTDKAAGEMGSRLQALGVEEVRASTFHAEALRQSARYSGTQLEVLPAKVPLLQSLVRSLPPPYRFVPTRDVAAEIERAKNRRVTAERYLESLGDHAPPVPPDLMAGLYGSYERRKERARLIDFEDLLERTIVLLEERREVADEIRDRYRAFTVDEYQDVNLLQESLLRAWTGGRDDLCVVGDDYQSIFGFTGATPEYLLGFPGRFPACRVFLLTSNYRSTPNILHVANRLVPRLGGSPKLLRPTRSSESLPVFQELWTGEEEADWVARHCARLAAEGLAWEQMAILYRINARSEAFEEALARAAVPYQIADSPFLRRPAARAVLARLKKLSGYDDLLTSVREVVRGLGYRDDDSTLEGEEATRQADLSRLLRLAGDFSEGGVAAFVSDLISRFTIEGDGRGVHLLTYHRAKGKEWDAVFLPRLEDRELPFALAKSPDAVAEERRLLYVGITRARRFLLVSWARQREGERPSVRRPSPFLAEIAGLDDGRRPAAGRGASARPDDELMHRLKAWRLAEARERGVPAYIVFSDAVLTEIAAAKPRNVDQLLRVKGIGPAKAAAYGEQLLRVLQAGSDGVT
ncbi:MAG: ATP-dependent DNA helicase UvrD2 [Actinomycetota bacterium]